MDLSYRIHRYLWLSPAERICAPVCGKRCIRKQEAALYVWLKYFCIPNYRIKFCVCFFHSDSLGFNLIAKRALVQSNGAPFVRAKIEITLPHPVRTRLELIQKFNINEIVSDAVLSSYGSLEGTRMEATGSPIIQKPSFLYIFILVEEYPPLTVPLAAPLVTPLATPLQPVTYYTF